MANSGGVSSRQGEHRKDMRSAQGRDVAAVASRNDKKKTERKKGRHQDTDDEEDDEEVLVFDEAGEEKAVGLRRTKERQ